MVGKLRISIGVIGVAAAIAAFTFMAMPTAAAEPSCDITGMRLAVEEARLEAGIDRWDRRNPDHGELITATIRAWAAACQS